MTLYVNRKCYFLGGGKKHPPRCTAPMGLYRCTPRVKKVMEDTKCSLDVAISWAISAKNSLKNVNGFSPNQIVFSERIQITQMLKKILCQLWNLCVLVSM